MSPFSFSEDSLRFLRKHLPPFIFSALSTFAHFYHLLHGGSTVSVENIPNISASIKDSFCPLPFLVFFPVPFFSLFLLSHRLISDHRFLYSLNQYKKNITVIFILHRILASDMDRQNGIIPCKYILDKWNSNIWSVYGWDCGCISIKPNLTMRTSCLRTSFQLILHIESRHGIIPVSHPLSWGSMFIALGNYNECSLRICNQLQSCNPILNFVVGGRSRRIDDPLLLHLCGSIHFYENIMLVWIGQPRFPGGRQRNAKIEFFRPHF